MNINHSSKEIELDNLEQIERGKRNKFSRENELHMNKTKLAKEIGISGQFLGLVEEGKGNLVYKSIKKLRNISGHSADFILYGFDDTTITKTKECLQHYSEEEFIYATKIITQIATFIKNT